MYFYSPSTKGFYREDIHGPRLISVMRPTPEGEEVKEGEEAPDPVYDLVENPDCNIPPDAVEVSIEEHADLMNGQATGNMVITPGADGRPVLQEHPAEFFWARLRWQRTQMLAESDWSQAGDIPDATKKRFQAYRQALRDLPANTKDPKAPVFPEDPG